MVLPRKLFSEILGVDVETAPVSEPAGERRKHARVALGSRARIFPIIETPGHDGCPVLVRDISRSGIGFLFDEPMAKGDEFIIQLPCVEKEPIQIHSMVTRCAPGGSGGTQWAIGAAFELVLNSTKPIEMPDEDAGNELEEADTSTAEDENAQSAVEDLFDKIMRGPPAPVRVPDTLLRRVLTRLCALRVIGVPLIAIARIACTINCAFQWMIWPLVFAGKRLAKLLRLDKIASPRIRHRLRPASQGKRHRESNSNALLMRPKIVAAPMTANTAAQQPVSPAINTPLIVGQSTDAPGTSSAARGRNSIFASVENPAAQAPVLPPIAVPMREVAEEKKTLEEPAAPLEVLPVAVTAAGARVVAPVIETLSKALIVVPTQTAEPVLEEKSPQVEMTHVAEPTASASLSEPQKEHVVVSQPSTAGTFLLSNGRIGFHGKNVRHPRRRPRHYFRFSTGTKSVMVGPV